MAGAKFRLAREATLDEAFDGLTAEEVRRIRDAGAACITPGLEGLAKLSGVTAKVRRSAAVHHGGTVTPAPSKNKRGRRS